MLRVFYCLLPLFFITIYSCSGDIEETQDDIESVDSIIEHVDLPSKLGLDSGEVKIFTMPTPLQMASALKMMQIDYNDGLLLSNGNIGVQSDIDLSLLLGMYLTDLGYTTVYNNSQKSLSYAKDIQFIMEELPIAPYVNDVFKKRFKENIENQDSLCKIILEGYNQANQYISESQNEALGLLILTGSYIEGLYLVTSSEAPEILINEHENVFIQQKIFLDNFVLLLDAYKSNPKIEIVINKLSKLKIAFDKIDIYFDNDKETFLLRKPITSSNRKEIGEIIKQLRNELVVNSQAT